MVILLVVFTVVVLQALGQQPATPRETKRAEIRVRVTDAESGQPLARALVRLTKVGSPGMVVGRSDEAGVCPFAGLEAGEYRVNVEPGEHRGTHLMGRVATPTGSNRPMLLREGEVRVVDVALPRARAIAVRVVDRWGDPLSGLRLLVIGRDGRRVPVGSFTATTDDRGRLRIFGLAPGEYVVCVDTEFAGGIEFAHREGFLRTCHPSAPNEAEAEAVQVDRSDIGELEIRMRTGRTFRVSGRILDASGGAPSKGSVGLSRYSPGGSAITGVPVDADGRFTLTNIHPGEYAIEASVGGPNRPEDRRPLETAFVPLRVDADLEDIVILLQRGIDVPGRVTTEDSTAALPPAPGSGLMILARLTNDRLFGLGSAHPAYVRDGSTFTLIGMFGRRTLEVDNVPNGWYVKSIRYAGREIIDEPIEFKEGGSLLEVSLSNRGASVVGRVLDDSGAAAAGALVLMLRAADDGSDARVISNTRATRNGTFRLGPARNGDYLLVALPPSTPMIQRGEWDRLTRIAAAAERLSLGELDERTIDLQLVKER